MKIISIDNLKKFWTQLKSRFVSKSGDTVNGDLIVGGGVKSNTGYQISNTQGPQLTTGWYTVFEGNNYATRGFATLLFISRWWNNSASESYILAITANQNHFNTLQASINQLAGNGTQQITKVRVLCNDNDRVKIQIYYNSSTQNPVTCSCVGQGQCVTPYLENNPSEKNKVEYALKVSDTVTTSIDGVLIPSRNTLENEIDQFKQSKEVL